VTERRDPSGEKVVKPGSLSLYAESEEPERRAQRERSHITAAATQWPPPAAEGRSSKPLVIGALVPQCCGLREGVLWLASRLGKKELNPSNLVLSRLLNSLFSMLNRGTCLIDNEDSQEIDRSRVRLDIVLVVIWYSRAI